MLQEWGIRNSPSCCTFRDGSDSADQQTPSKMVSMVDVGELLRRKVGRVKKAVILEKHSDDDL